MFWPFFFCELIRKYEKITTKYDKKIQPSIQAGPAESGVIRIRELYFFNVLADDHGHDYDGHDGHDNGYDYDGYDGHDA